MEPSRPETGTPPTSIAELDALRDRCRKLVAWRASLSAAAGGVPLPGVDLLADALNYATLLPRISRRFGLAPEQVAALEPEMQSVVTAAAGKFTETLVARTVTPKLVAAVLKRFGRQITVREASKFLPVLGTLTAAGVSYGTMVWFGFKHVDECHAVARAALEAAQHGPSGGGEPPRASSPPAPRV